MVRPQKNNAEYFSHDADMRNDVKVKALRRKFKHAGYAVWCFLLETLADMEFFEIDYNELSKEFLAADFDVSVKELDDIVAYCCKIGLLKMERDRFLYSEALQRRFAPLLEKRRRDRERLARLSGGKPTDNAPENEEEDAETALGGDFSGDNPHSIVKESKPKENREKNTKYPCQDIADLWNGICVSLPRVQKLSDSRRNKIKCRCNEWGKTPDVWLQTAADIFRRMQASDFLKGGNSHQWTATFDWLFSNGENSIKVMEGNYDNKRGEARQQTGETRAKIGIGEYIEKATGRRTYGSGKVTIPPDAPPRPGEGYCWDEASKTWLYL